MPCPLSRREIRVRALLPRLGTRIVCVDNGSGLAERLAEYIASIGAPDVAVLDGGTPAWAAAGYVLFSGVNVPSVCGISQVTRAASPASSLTTASLLVSPG